MRRIPRLLLPVTALVLLAAACSGSDGGAVQQASTATTVADGSAGSPESLYVATAEGGTLADGTLTLTGVDPETTTFTDRPFRDAGVLAVSDLVGEWEQEGFADDPPNAALVTMGDSGHVTTVVELGMPSLDGTTLTFPATVLDDGTATGSLADVTSGGHDGDLAQAALFIDDGAQGTLSFWTIQGTWGGGNSTITFDDTTTSSACKFPCGTFLQMQGPGEVQFTVSSKELGVLQAIDGPVAGPIQASVSGFTMIDGDALTGTASLASGSDLQVGTQGNTGPFQALPDGSFSVPLSNG